MTDNNDIKPCSPPPDWKVLAMILHTEIENIKDRLGYVPPGVRAALRRIEYVKQQMEDFDND